MRTLLPYPRKRTGPGRRVCEDMGFTLIEVIASLMMLGLLSAVFGMGLVAAMQSHEFSRANVQLAQKAQPAMARMTRELMELSDIEQPSAPGPTASILYHRMPQDDTVTVQRFGLLFDPATNVIRLTTNYQGGLPLDATQGHILVDGVSNLEFNFFSSGTDVWDGNNIRLLSSIEIIMDLFRPEDVSSVKNFRTIVHMRNTNNFGGALPRTRPESQADYNCFIGSILTERD